MEDDMTSADIQIINKGKSIQNEDGEEKFSGSSSGNEDIIKVESDSESSTSSSNSDHISNTIIPQSIGVSNSVVIFEENKISMTE